MREHENLCLKMVLDIVCIFVCGHFSLWRDVYALKTTMQNKDSLQSIMSTKLNQQRFWPYFVDGLKKRIPTILHSRDSSQVGQGPLALLSEVPGLD